MPELKAVHEYEVLDTQCVVDVTVVTDSGDPHAVLLVVGPAFSLRIGSDDPDWLNNLADQVGASADRLEDLQAEVDAYLNDRDD